MAILCYYPIQQHGFDQNSVDTTITDYRATRIVDSSPPANTTKIQWEFNLGGDSFYLTTNSSGIVGDIANILDSTFTRLDMWFPPAMVFTVRTRYYVSGVWSGWSGRSSHSSLGYMNSYDKATVFDRASVTIPATEPYTTHFPQ